VFLFYFLLFVCLHISSFFLPKRWNKVYIRRGKKEERKIETRGQKYNVRICYTGRSSTAQRSAPSGVLETVTLCVYNGEITGHGRPNWDDEHAQCADYNSKTRHVPCHVYTIHTHSRLYTVQTRTLMLPHTDMFSRPSCHAPLLCSTYIINWTTSIALIFIFNSNVNLDRHDIWVYKRRLFLSFSIYAIVCFTLSSGSRNVWNYVTHWLESAGVAIWGKQDSLTFKCMRP